MIYLGIYHPSFKKPVVFFLFFFSFGKLLVRNFITVGKGEWREGLQDQGLEKAAQICSGKLKTFPEHNRTGE